MLALSDLGLYTVMVYSLYKPVAEGDTARISALIRYYQKLYLIVAAAVTVIGVACVPFLKFLVKDSNLTQQELIVYYLLILANSTCSYFAISKSTLIRADQNINIIQSVQAATKIGLNVVQVLVLVFFKNYTLFLVIPIISTLINNIILTKIADRKYPYLKDASKSAVVNTEIRREITTNLKATFLYKLGATIINSTNNILISVLLGTVMVGYYSNYSTVVSLVVGLFGIIINAVLASIGNFNATQNNGRKFALFKLMLMIFYFIAGFCAACYLSIFDDFITVWIGKQYVLDSQFLIALVISTTVTCISNPLWMMRESAGVFRSVRFVMLAAAGVNIALSCVLAQFLGLAGIILATPIAHLVTLFWYEPRMLCKQVFHVPVWHYWKKVLLLLLAIIPCGIVGWVLHGFSTTNVFAMAGKVLLCGITTVASFVVLFRKTEEMQWIMDVIVKILRRKTA